jgi:hypothetical protein
MEKFSYSNKERLFNLQLKLKIFLKILLKKKNFNKNYTKFFDFLVQLNKIYRRVKSYDRKAV